MSRALIRAILVEDEDAVARSIARRLAAHSVELTHLSTGEQIEALLAALGRLPDPQKRAVIMLRFFGGLSDQEIGRRLQITPNHVRVLRHHAIQRLRRDPALQRFFGP